MKLLFWKEVIAFVGDNKLFCFMSPVIVHDFFRSSH